MVPEPTKSQWIPAASYFHTPPALDVISKIGFVIFLLVSPLAILQAIFFYSLFQTLALGAFIVCVLFLFWYTRIEEQVQDAFVGDFFRYGWCRSRFSHELGKHVVRFLEEQEIYYELLHHREEGPKTLLSLLPDRAGFTRQKLFWVAGSLTPGTTILLPKHQLGIGLYWSKFYLGPTYSTIVDGASEEEQEEVKQLVKECIEAIPETNPFCSRCQGKRHSSCYGPQYQIKTASKMYGDSLGPPHWDHDTIQGLLRNIDPYRDEETLTALIRRKERWGEEYLKDEEQEERELRSFIDP